MCMAVGDNGRAPEGLLWNGQHLVKQAPYNPSDSSSTLLQGVSCPTTTFCMAVGQSSSGWLAEAWDGTSWSPVGFSGSGSSVYPRSVDCPSRHSCFAAGVDGNDPLVAHWSGGMFSPVASQPVNAESGFNAISCSGATCMAVGHWSNASFKKYGYLVERSTGSGFQPITAPELGSGEHGDPWAVSCPSTRFCGVTGEQDSKSAYQSLGEVYRGGRLDVTPTPDPTHNSFPYNVLYGVSCLSKADCVTAGQGGAYSYGGPNPTSADRSTIAARWNGHQWALVPSANPGNQPSGFVAVSCAPDGTCAAVGLVTRSSDYTKLPLFEILRS